jgi:hypothetical protein
MVAIMTPHIARRRETMGRKALDIREDMKTFMD